MRSKEHEALDRYYQKQDECNHIDIPKCDMEEDCKQDPNWTADIYYSCSDHAKELEDLVGYPIRKWK